MITLGKFWQFRSQLFINKTFKLIDCSATEFFVKKQIKLGQIWPSSEVLLIYMKMIWKIMDFFSSIRV